MKDVFAYLRSPSFFALIAAVVGAYLVVFKGENPTAIAATGTALVGLFRVAGAIDNHAQATKDAASAPSSPAATPTPAQALAVLGAALAPAPAPEAKP